MVTKRSSASRGSNKKTRSRNKPGSGGSGEYYHVEVRSGDDFVTFRTQDVGDPGHIQRVAGKRETGSWATVKWLIGKEDAHVDGDKLVGDTRDAKDVIQKLGSTPLHKRGDVFEVSTRKNVAGKSKPASTQKKTQAARSKSK